MGGNTTTYSYDELNEVTQKSYVVAAPTLSTPNVFYTYNKGWLTAVCTDASLSCTNSNVYKYTQFDSLGRVLASTQTVNNTPYQPFGYTYDLADDLLSLTLPSGRVVKTSFDTAGRPTSVKGTFSSAQTTYVSSASYAPHSALQHLGLGNTLTETTTFNSHLQPQSIQASTPSVQNILNLGYTFQSNGNIQTQTITRASLGTWTQTYGYDGVSRLISASESGTGSWSENYNYDYAGNRWVSNPLISTLETPAAQSWYSASTNQIPAWSYDPSGNIIGMGSGLSRNFEYDAENRQVSATINNQGTTYQYDGLGQRVQRVTASGTSTYLYDAFGNLATESTTIPQNISGTIYLTADHVGSTRLITDSGANVKKCSDYLPFGQEIPIGGSPGRSGCYGSSDVAAHKYTGMERDTETGIDFFQARYMSPPEGRFTSPDNPFLSSNPADPQSWNLYSYAANDPMLFVDPTGEDPVQPCVNGVNPNNGAFCTTVTGQAKVTGQASGDNINDFLLMSQLMFLQWNPPQPGPTRLDGPPGVSFWESLSIRTPGQSFKKCMEQNANTYSIGGFVELAANANLGTEGSWSKKPLVSFFLGNSINSFFFGSASDAGSTAVNNAPTLVASGMGKATTYGRRTATIMSLNLAGKGGLPVALSQGASKAGGLAASAVRSGIGRVGDVFSLGLSLTSRLGIDTAFTGAEMINCSH